MRAPVLVAGLALAAVTLRPQVVGIGPLLPRVQADLGVSHAVGGLLVTIPVLAMGVFAPPAAMLARRLGAPRAVGVALALVALAGIVRALAPGAAAVLVLTLPIGIGMGLGNALMVIAVKERFAHRPLLVTGVYTAGIQLGGTAAAASAVPIADAAGDWRAAPLVFGVAALVSLAGWLRLARGMPRTAAPERPARFPVDRSAAWLLAGLFVLIGQVYYGLTAWLPAAYQERGFTPGQTGLMSAVLNLATIPAGLLTAALGHRIARRSGLLAGAVLMLAATSLLVVAPGGAYVWCAAAGFANGTLFTLAMTLPLDVADTPAGVGAMAGMMLGVGYVGIALAPTVLGAVRDATGSFHAVLVVVAATSAALVCVTAACSATRLARGVRPL